MVKMAIAALAVCEYLPLQRIPQQATAPRHRTDAQREAEPTEAGSRAIPHAILLKMNKG